MHRLLTLPSLVMMVLSGEMQGVAAIHQVTVFTVYDQHSRHLLAPS